MERITDLKHDELVKLTEDDLQTFIDIEIAYDGIKLVNPIKLKEILPVDIVPTELFYSVHEKLYKTLEEASTVAKVPAYGSDYDYNAGGYEYKYCTPRQEATVTPVKFYKKEDVDHIRDILKKNKEAKEFNEKVNGDYQKYCKAIDACRSEVMTIYYDAMEKERRIEAAIADFNKYLKIAKGDQQVALEFFTNAYKDEDEETKSIALGRIEFASRV